MLLVLNVPAATLVNVRVPPLALAKFTRLPPVAAPTVIGFVLLEPIPPDCCTRPAVPLFRLVIDEVLPAIAVVSLLIAVVLAAMLAVLVPTC